MNLPTETDDVESLIPHVVKLRDKALHECDFGTAVMLSHVIAWLNWIKKQVQK